jgi:hypothetical protein
MQMNQYLDAARQMLGQLKTVQVLTWRMQLPVNWASVYKSQPGVQRDVGPASGLEVRKMAEAGLSSISVRLQLT